MGTVIGPLHWTVKDRTACWRVMRDLREDVKLMRMTDPVRNAGYIQSEWNYAGSQLAKYVA